MGALGSRPWPIPHPRPAARLRPLRREDLPSLHRWRQDPGLFASLGSPFTVRAEAEALAHMEGWLTAKPTEVRLAIEADGALVGDVSLQAIHPVYRGASFHILIGAASNRGRGVGRAAAAALLAHAFDDLNLHRVEAEVLATNAASLALHDRLGFVREGVRREAAFKQGRWTDVVLLSRLTHEAGASTTA